MLLREYLKTLPADEIIAVGASSGFLYIGTVKKFADKKCHYRGLGMETEGNPMDSIPVSQRNIKSVYRQDVVDMALVILIEGREYGICWTKSEYDNEEQKRKKSRTDCKMYIAGYCGSSRSHYNVENNRSDVPVKTQKTKGRENPKAASAKPVKANFEAETGMIKRKDKNVSKQEPTKKLVIGTTSRSVRKAIAAAKMAE